MQPAGHHPQPGPILRPASTAPCHCAAGPHQLAPRLPSTWARAPARAPLAPPASPSATGPARASPPSLSSLPPQCTRAIFSAGRSSLLPRGSHAPSPPHISTASVALPTPPLQPQRVPMPCPSGHLAIALSGTMPCRGLATLRRRHTEPYSQVVSNSAATEPLLHAIDGSKLPLPLDHLHISLFLLRVAHADTNAIAARAPRRPVAPADQPRKQPCHGVAPLSLYFPSGPIGKARAELAEIALLPMTGRRRLLGRPPVDSSPVEHLLTATNLLQPSPELLPHRSSLAP